MALVFVDPDSLSTPELVPGSGKTGTGKPGVQVMGYTPPESNKFDTKKSYGTPTKLLENVIQTESSGDPLAINPTSGAMGLGQFMPETVAMLHKQGVEFNPFNKDEARAAMDYYISQLHKEHGGDYVKAMKAYGGFKTKDPEKYLDKVLEGVDLAENNKLFVSPESLPGSTNIPESELQPKPNLTLPRAAGLFARGATPAVTGAAVGGTLAGPAGALVGSVALPAGDVLNTGINAVTGGINRFAGTNIPQLQMPSDVAQKWMSNAGFPVAQTGPERMIQTAGSAMGGTAAELPAMTRLATTAASPFVRGVAETAAAAPKSQIAAAPISAVASQGVYEKTGNPYLAMGAGALAAAPFGFTIKQNALNVPKQSELAQAANNLYAQAESSNIRFNSYKFSDAMKVAEHELENEGYTPEGFTGIKGVLNKMQETEKSKDFNRLQALRKMIQTQQNSPDRETRRLASILKDNFDDYILNAPPQHLTSGNPEGLQIWQDARQTYSKLKKAEIFDDMFENAQFDKDLNTSLTRQMKQLATNPRRMRTFTPEEQSAIIDVAKGNSPQKALALVGKFAPDSVLGLVSAGAAHVGGGNIASLPLMAGSYASKIAAQKLKTNEISKLADMMRLGKMPKFESRAKNVPATALRGLLSGNPTYKEQ